MKKIQYLWCCNVGEEKLHGFLSRIPNKNSLTSTVSMFHFLELCHSASGDREQTKTKKKYFFPFANGPNQSHLVSNDFFFISFFF